MSTTAPNRKSALPIVVFTLVAFLLGILGVRYLVFLQRDQSTVEMQRASVRLETRQKLDAQDAVRLQTGAWLDEDRTTARIPIDRAMELMVTKLQLKPVAASSVAVPEPVKPEPPATAIVPAPPENQTNVPDPSESPNTQESPKIEGPATPSGVTNTPSGLESATSTQSGEADNLAPAGKVRPDTARGAVPAHDGIPKAGIQADADAPVDALPAPNPPGENATPQSIMTPNATPEEEANP